MIKESAIVANLASSSLHNGLPELAPIIAEQEWIYARPLSVILSVLQSDVHAIINDRRVAAQVRILWKLSKNAERTHDARVSRESERQLNWWRSQGCPV